jgi:hypothetical protein
MFIPAPGSEFFPSRIPYPNFSHPGSVSNNLSILTLKIVSMLSEIWSGRVVHPGFGFLIRILIFYPSRTQGTKQHRIPDPEQRLIPSTLYPCQTRRWRPLVLCEYGGAPQCGTVWHTSVGRAPSGCKVPYQIYSSMCTVNLQPSDNVPTTCDVGCSSILQ